MRKIIFTLFTFMFATTIMAQEVEIKHLTEAEFLTKVFNYQTEKTWKYNGKTPCIVDFYTTWCGPCKRLAPILQELATEYKGKIVVYKVNTENERSLAQAFGVSSIPTMLFCPMSGNPHIYKGLLPKETLNELINDVLLK